MDELAGLVLGRVGGYQLPAALPMSVFRVSRPELVAADLEDIWLTR
jgi:hypothetical protein